MTHHVQGVTTCTFMREIQQDGENVGISVVLAHLLTLQNTGCVFQRYCLWVNVFLFLGLQSFTRTGTQ